MEEMEMPCACVCGSVFELNDGNPCDRCDGVFCHDCVPQPWDCCPQCRPSDGESDD